MSRLKAHEKEYLNARVDDMLRTIKFENFEEVDETFDHLIEQLRDYKQTCTRVAGILKRIPELR